MVFVLHLLYVSANTLGLHLQLEFSLLAHTLHHLVLYETWFGAHKALNYPSCASCPGLYMGELLIFRWT